MELKPIEKPDGGGGEADEMTSMLHSRSQFDVASASMLGDDEPPRYSTLGRSRPVIIAPQSHREGTRTAVSLVTYRWADITLAVTLSQIVAGQCMRRYSAIAVSVDRCHAFLTNLTVVVVQSSLRSI